MDRRATKIAMPTDDNSLKPKSVIRVQSPFVLLPCRLSATFAEGVAGYAETKRQTICTAAGRKDLESQRTTVKHTRGGLMTD